MNPFPRTEAEIAAQREYWDGQDRRRAQYADVRAVWAELPDSYRYAIKSQSATERERTERFQSQPMAPDKPRGAFFGLKYALPAVLVLWTAIAMIVGWAMRGPIR